MTDETQDIFLRAIDTEHLEEVDDNPEAVQFGVKLSTTPSPLWAEEFELAYRQTPYLVKPPVYVDGDTLQVVFLPRYTSELPAFLRFITLIVHRANQEARRTEEMHRSQTHESSKEKFRAFLKRVELPQ